MSNLWDDEPEEFRDIPDETQLGPNGQPVSSGPVNVQVQNRSVPPANQSYRPSNVPSEPAPKQSHDQDNEYDVTSVLDILEDELEDDFTAVLNDANLRIEQGRLYQMIMNHDLFHGMDADERAVQNVQKEIRKFAKERMEIMLGMRQEQMTKAYAEFNAAIANPFNELEVDILKKIASKATNGATEKPEANELASSLREEPRRQTINPIGGSTNNKRSLAPKPQAKLQSKPQAPIQRKKSDATIDQILAEEGVPRELIEENYRPIGKSLDQLTPEELAIRQKETAARLAKRTTVKSSSALPMATPEQQEFLAMQRASQVGQGPGMVALLEKIKSMPIKNP